MPADDSLDETVETFVALEDELGSVAAGEHDAGTVAGAAEVRADEVPDGYPARVCTDHALRLDVAVDGDATVETYQEWPETGREDSDVLALLDGARLAPGEDTCLSRSTGHACVARPVAPPSVHSGSRSPVSPAARARTLVP